MPYDRFMIAPINSGLQTDTKPWLIPDDAFSKLENVYIYRGRVRKRPGTRLINSGVSQTVSQLYSRLRINLGNTDTSGNFSGTVPGTVFSIGQQFSIGAEIFTVYQTGTPAIMLDTGVGGVFATTKTYNTSTGALVIAGAVVGGVATPVFFYPATPVTGLITYQTAVSAADPTIAFDTQFSYTYSPAGSGGWDILGGIPPASGSAIWTGTDSQLFWGTTWQGVTPAIRYLFVTNNNPPDGIQYWNGTIWQTLAPVINAAGDVLTTCLAIVTFKNHLVAFNPTITLFAGGTVTFTNQAIWAAFGDPTASNAWNNSVPGQGNALNAATMEDIMSVEFVKDRLIVYFERSTYEFAYTGNQLFPFTWQQINTELGTESPFSTVPFDRVCLTIGNTGVHACNGQNVERIDDKIPLQVWNIRTGVTQIDRVYGIRDYYAEQVYWTFPNVDANFNSQTYPNKILAFNYLTGSWALFDDSITAFGYFYASSVTAITWDSTDITWDNDEVTWDSGTAQSLNQEIICGNQEGFTFLMDSDVSEQCPSLQLTNIIIPSMTTNVTLTVINHNFNGDDFVYLNNLNGIEAGTGVILALFYPIISITDPNTFIIAAPDIQGVLMRSFIYTGGGTVTRVPRVDIYTKQLNFYIDQDRNSAVQRIDFLVDRTDTASITVDYLTSTAPNGLVSSAQATGTLLGTSVLTTAPYDNTLYPYEQYQDRLWHPIYPIAEGNAIQLRLYFSDEQLGDPTGATFFQPLQIHAMTFYCTPTSWRAM